MAEIEVSWDEYLAFYSATAAEGRSTDTEGTRTRADVDAISGPTPPYGQPDQNWGLVGQRRIWVYLQRSCIAGQKTLLRDRNNFV